ncbi:hypothetical protein DesfrDRAFT_1215 [Solidesulfovibrio fructosivorans JJ]]|uniref:Uncharacterized protein n=1 Tax=Solidesulfovibrio fructosivorans JJ] TaxID=596151 RepID=E1JUB6_SOLFR|nr:hypothetical protein [Solidesulfovibrio fructosivorans]EFL52046.1 hypothetical protein DesfrDRAFT_1215 [Solidesulfovibrio fructosivorans JJ]]
MGVHYPKGWRQTIPLTNIANLFALYRSQGDVTIASATTNPTTLDGPMQVVRYGALTVNAVLTVTNRCRGLVVLCDSLTMGSAGGLSMTGKGPVGSSKWTKQDLIIPTSMVFTGVNVSPQAFLNWVKATGYCLFDPNLFAAPPAGMPDVVADYVSWAGRGTNLITASGRGARGARYSQAASQIAGNPGGAGLSAPGGGGCGGIYASGAGYISSNGFSAPGQMWGGGAGSEMAEDNAYHPDADQYSALYGGGILLIICRGNVTITTGAVLSADATAYLSSSGYGQAGGGFVGLYYGGTLSNSGTIRANGSAGSGSPAGGNGGAGATSIKTFVQMGW